MFRHISLLRIACDKGRNDMTTDGERKRRHEDNALASRHGLRNSLIALNGIILTALCLAVALDNDNITFEFVQNIVWICTGSILCGICCYACDYDIEMRAATFLRNRMRSTKKEIPQTDTKNDKNRYTKMRQRINRLSQLLQVLTTFTAILLLLHRSST